MRRIGAAERRARLSVRPAPGPVARPPDVPAAVRRMVPARVVPRSRTPLEREPVG